MDDIRLKLEILEKENAVLRSRGQIENLGARYADMNLSCRCREIFDELWADDPEIRLEIGSSGVYEGERVRFYYRKDAVPGRFVAMQLTTPHIVIKENPDYAEANWMVTGAETDAGDLGLCPAKDLAEREILSSEDEKGRRYRAEWFWQRMEMKLKKQNGEWKIFSLHIREIFRCPYDKSWVLWAKERQETDGLRTDEMFIPSDASEEELRPPEFHASYASTDHWQYDTDAFPPKGLL